MSAAVTGPEVGEERLVVRVPDPDRAYAGVRLHTHVPRPGGGVEAHWRDDELVWVVEVERGPVDRVEYVLERRRHDGATDVGPDPGNPRRVLGPGEEWSVVEFPGYRPPDWVSAVVDRGAGTPVA